MEGASPEEGMGPCPSRLGGLPYCGEKVVTDPRITSDYKDKVWQALKMETDLVQDRPCFSRADMAATQETVGPRAKRGFGPMWF